MNSETDLNLTNNFKSGTGYKNREDSSFTFKKDMPFRQAIEDSNPGGVAVIDKTGKQVFVNQSFCRIVGWSEEELLGKHPPFPYWPQTEIEKTNKAFQLTLENKAPKGGFDLFFCHRNGKKIPVNVIISPFVQENNETFFLANVIDLSERKQMEEELLKSQLLLVSSIESQKDAIIFSTDRDYRYLYFNKAHQDSMKYAYNADIRTGMNILDCVPPENDRKRIKKYIDLAFKGESSSITQTFGDVNPAYYEVFFNPILDDKNEIMGCTVLARNISDRLQVEKELSDGEIKFKEIINQINDVIVVFDDHGKIIIWNKGAENVCGLKAEEALNKNIVDIQVQLTPPPQNDRALLEEVINGIIKQETPEVFNQIIDSEIIQLNSGKLRNIQSMVFPIKLKEENLFCLVIRDVTEIKRYDKEFLRISSEKDKFYSLIAQYLYTPFNVFNNFSKLMAEELDSLPIREIQKMAGMMSKSASNLYNLLDNLLQWTKMNQGKISFEPQKLNFKKISQDAVSVLKPLANAKRISIDHSVEEEVYAYADMYMLKTILRNLVSHSIKYAGNDGQIEIQANDSFSKITVSVTDHGPEINPDYLSKQLDASQMNLALGTSEEKGSTLGILLCKELVEKHGGEIWREKHEGKGKEFRFTLPAAAG